MIDWGVAIKILASLVGCMLFAFGQSYNQNPDGKTMVHIAAVSISVGSYLLGLFQAKPTGNGGGGAPGPIARSLMLLMVLPAQLGVLLRAAVVVVLVVLATGCASSPAPHLVCFDRGQAGYAVGQASAILAAKCAANRLSDAECARLAEIEAAAKQQILTPPAPSSSVDAEAIMRLLIGAAKLAI